MAVCDETDSVSMGILLTVVSPTYNEFENVDTLIATLQNVLCDLSYEILIVDDDSPDQTWKRVEEIGRKDPRVRVLRRQGKRGLGHAVIDGFAQARGEYVACIDGDLQHDPKILPAMLAAVRRDADMALGCRYMKGGGTGDWNWMRVAQSRMATKLANLVVGTPISDPMSGYFIMRRHDFLAVREELNGDGFKILLEIMTLLRPRRVVELPYTFGIRRAGQSKVSSLVAYHYLRQLYRLSSERRLALFRIIKFGIVGLAGVAVNLAAMSMLMETTSLRDWRCSLLASVIATVHNYAFNNFWTFRNQTQRGSPLVRGYLSYVLCAVIGLGITTGTFELATRAAGRLIEPSANPLSSLLILALQFGAILPGMLVNYELNKLFTWTVPATEEKRSTIAVRPNARKAASGTLS